MKSQDLNYFNIGPRLTLAFALLIALIVCGNGLVLWQFQMARLQTERLTSGNQQVIAALQLDRNLLIFYHRLDELVQSQDAHRFVTKAEPLSSTLLEQIRQTRSTVTHFPAKSHVDPAFLPSLDAIETELPSLVDAFTALAKLGEWDVVRVRLANGMKVFETQISNLVTSIDQESSKELMNTVSSMRTGQRRIVLVVPITAISTVFIATLFGWAVTQRMLELRVEERVGERTRLARELHDTLLQSLHGLMFEFQAARNLLPRRPEDAIQTLNGAISGTEQAIAESQDAIQELRSESSHQSDLAESLTAAAQELSASQDANRDSPEFHIIVEGERRRSSSIFQVEVYRIAREALRNAFRHAHAHRIEIEIRYGAQEFRLRIRDDGEGIDKKVLAEGGRSGHWGLRGVRERAQRIGGQLDLWSESGAGTEVQLTVPAAVAYEKLRHGARFRLFRKARIHDRS